MRSLVPKKETAKEIPSLYLIYGYREIEEPNRWYVGSCLYIREQIRDEFHRRRFGDGKKFRRALKKVANGRCFDELVQKVVLEVVWGTPQDCIDRENIHMDRLDSIQNGFNSQHAGLRFLSEANKGKPSKNRGKKIPSISKALKGRSRPDLAERNRKFFTGRPSKLRGISIRQETKDKISFKNKGAKRSALQRAKMSSGRILANAKRKHKGNPTLW